MIEISVQGLERDDSNNLKNDGGETHNSQWNQKKRCFLFRQPQQDQEEDKKEERKIQQPERPQVGEECENSLFQPPEQAAPQDRIEEVAYGNEVPVDCLLSLDYHLFQHVDSQWV